MRAPLSLFLFLLPLAFWSCVDSNDTVTGGGPDLVPVQIDLVRGFSGKEVILNIDNVLFFSVNEMGPSPIAGPEASFVTSLEKGSHLLSAWTRTTGVTAFRDSTRLVIGAAEKYYIALDIFKTDAEEAGKLRAILQTRPFGYL